VTVRNVRNMSEPSDSDRREVSEMSERPLGLGHSDALSDGRLDGTSSDPSHPWNHEAAAYPMGLRELAPTAGLRSARETSVSTVRFS